MSSIDAACTIEEKRTLNRMTRCRFFDLFVAMANHIVCDSSLSLFLCIKQICTQDT